MDYYKKATKSDYKEIKRKRRSKPKVDKVGENNNPQYILQLLLPNSYSN